MCKGNTNNSSRLSSILISPKQTQNFENYLKQEFNVENLEFTLSQKQFIETSKKLIENDMKVYMTITLVTKKYILQLARVLYKSYICPSSSKQINISAYHRLNASEAINVHTESCKPLEQSFDQYAEFEFNLQQFIDVIEFIQKDIKNMINNDIIPRYD
eukprot:Pgem_evm1s18575